MKKIHLTLLALLVSLSTFAIAPITGTTSLCLNASTTLYDTTLGGTWSSSNPAIATVGSSTGIVSGVGVGTLTITYTVGVSYVTASLVVNPLPTAFTITGGGTYCTGGTGVHIGLGGSQTGVTYQLYNGAGPVGSPISGTGLALDFGSIMGSGTYTIVATFMATGCSITMSGTVTIIVAAHPTMYSLSAGPFCAGTTKDITLSGSDVGVTYTLDSASVPIITLPGTGSPLDFGFHMPASYSVIATGSGGCTTTSSGAYVINPLPAIFTVTGGGHYCAGGTGAHIGLSGSQAGVSYQLHMGGISVGVPLMGTGGSLDFGPYTTIGTYTIVATNVVTGCTSTMLSSVTITIDPLPLVDTVTGGGLYCSGGTGVHIGLSGSQIGINYQLYHATSPVGAAIPGTGLPLDFGLLTGAGTYTIVAINASTGCTNAMYGSAVISIVPPPVLYTLSGTGTFCSGGLGGGHITLSGSDTGVTYTLDSSGVAIASLPGTGSPLDFGYHSAGTYTIVAVGPGGCTSTSSTITVTILPTVTPSITISATPGFTVTAGTSVTFTAIEINGGITPIYIWSVNGSPVATTGPTYSYVPFDHDSVTVCMISDAPCAVPDTVCYSGIMHVLPFTTGNQQLTVPENIRIYPNPATDELTIKMDAQNFNSFTITNNVGQALVQQQIFTTQTKVDIKTLPTGIYFITLHGEKGNTVQKFVKM